MAPLSPLPPLPPLPPPPDVLDSFDDHHFRGCVWQVPRTSLLLLLLLLPPQSPSLPLHADIDEYEEVEARTSLPMLSQVRASIARGLVSLSA